MVGVGVSVVVVIVVVVVVVVLVVVIVGRVVARGCCVVVMFFSVFILFSLLTLLQSARGQQWVKRLDSGMVECSPDDGSSPSLCFTACCVCAFVYSRLCGSCDISTRALAIVCVWTRITTLCMPVHSHP